MTSYQSGMFVLDGLVVLTTAAHLALIVAGLRALVSGRDVVWECSWQFPLRVWGALAAVRQVCIPDVRALAARVPHVQSVMFRMPRGTSRARAQILPFSLNVLQGTSERRVRASQHYLTIGERMRARTGTRTLAA